MKPVQMQLKQSMSPQQPTQLRDLGLLERFRVVVHDLGFHYNVAVIAHYSHRGQSAGSIRQLVFSAFTKAIHVHPALGVTVVQKDTQNPCFAQIGAINLHQAISFQELPPREFNPSRRIEMLLAEENSRGFEEGQLPLWRAIVLTEDRGHKEQAFSIAFIWHHVIGDGRSGLAVHSTLLNSIKSYRPTLDESQDLLARNTEDWWAPTSASPLLPPLEQILSLSTSPSTVLEECQEATTKTSLQESSETKKWSGGPYNYEQPILTEIRYISIPANSTQNLVACCRKEGTTITALLQAVMGKVLFDITDADRVRAACAISLRRFFPPQLKIDDSVMGLWISAFCTDYGREEFRAGDGKSAVWARARENTSRINFEIAKGDEDIDIGSLQYTKDFKASLMAKMGKSRENSFGLTNLGVFPNTRDDEASGWDISDISFSQSCHANGSAVQVCIVSLEGGNMNIIFNWQRGVVEESFVEEIRSLVWAELIYLSTPDINRY